MYLPPSISLQSFSLLALIPPSNSPEYQPSFLCQKQQQFVHECSYLQFDGFECSYLQFDGFECSYLQFDGFAKLKILFSGNTNIYLVGFLPALSTQCNSMDEDWNGGEKVRP